MKTKLTYDEFKELIDYIKKHDCIPMSTPFDEKSVDWCVQMNLSLIKIASSDINDWLLLNKIASTKKPVIISTGGANDKQIDDVIKFFTNRNIPIAVNHCVSKYPSEDNELELDQIDYLKQKYPDFYALLREINLIRLGIKNLPKYQKKDLSCYRILSLL